MDKYEYRVRVNEIEELIRQGAYAEAAEIADTIDWRRVKSVMMLCKVSDLYKMNRRYEDARDMLLLAYERRPGGRSICYSLCELSIKMEEYVQAIEYYKEYVQAVSSPMDTGRYVLQYKLYEAQDVSLEERIAVLEKLKQCDYLPKWGYELAYLYHRVGLASRCVEECDELIAWFGDGKYVMKAMELKMLHQPLSPEQQKKYDHRFDDLNVEEQLTSQEASVEEVSAEETEGRQNDEDLSLGDTQVYTGVGEEESAKQEDEMDIHVKTMDVGQYNTINLQAELAEGLREVLAEERPKVTIENPITRSIMAPMLESNTEALDYPDAEDAVAESSQAPVEEMESSEVFFGETGDISSLQETVVPDITAEIVMEQLRQENTPQEEVQAEPAEQEEPEVQAEPVEQEKPEALEVQAASVIHAEPPKALANVLSQESDGQISLVMPERESIEKQITGQISLEDILAEWERMKKENQEKREEEVRQHVLQQTGTMFTEFEASVRDGLLEQLERGKNVEGLEEAVEEEPADSEDEVIGEEPVVAEDEVIEEEPVDSEEEVIEEEPVVAEDEVIEEEPVAAEGEVIEEEPVVAEDEIIEEESVVSQEIEEAAEALDDAIEDNDEVEELEEIQEQTAEDAEVLQEEISGEEATADSVEEESIIAEEEETSEEESEQEEISEEEEPEQEEISEEDAAPVVERDKEKVRSLTREEKELFGPYIQSRAAREQLVKAIDNISLAAFTGNIIVTGEEGMDTLSLAKNMIREVQATDSNFSGKVAKISGAALNKKDVGATLAQLKNGALIISKASDMNEETAKSLHKALQQESVGIVVVLEGSRKAIDRFLKGHEELRECFNARMDVEALSNDMLVAFGKQYAREQEYSIDDLGMLALHTRIEDMQTIDHSVTVVEVKELVDEAIRHANRKTLGHFFDILFAKRYDEEDMIILSEKDFV